MKYYKVISLSVSGRKNKIYRLNEVVPETSFIEGHADKLCRERHLQLVEEDDVVAKMHKAIQPEAVDIPKTDDSDTKQGDETTPPADTEGGQDDAGQPGTDEKTSEKTEAQGDDGDGEEKEPEGDGEKKGDEIKKISRQQLMADLKSKGIEFSKNATKEELYVLWKQANA